ncbi:MAG: hypothetical protein Tsb009_13900 [Planctomycetaceae bacterium]
MPTWWVGSPSVAIWSLLLMASFTWFSRRLLGAFSPPESAWPCLLAMTGMFLATLLVCLIFRREEISQRQQAHSLLVGSLTLLPPMLVGGALLPLSSIWGTSAFVTCMLMMAGGFFLLDPIQRHQIQKRLSEESRAGISSQSTIKPDDLQNPKSEPAPESEQTSGIHSFGLLQHEESISSESDEEAVVSQRMSRSLMDQGATEIIRGTVTVEFQPGQKVSVVHLPFSPPFDEAPQLECEGEGEYDVRIRQAVVKSYGARLDVRRSDGIDEPAKIAVAYAATARRLRENVA